MTDPAVDAMRAVVAGLGLRTEWRPESGEYAAVDVATGVVRYRWKEAAQLIDQMTGDNMPKNEKRNRIARGLYAIQRPDGSICYEVGCTVDGKWRYGGRFETSEEALDRLDEWGLRPQMGAIEAPRPPGETSEEARLVDLWRRWKQADGAYREALEKLDSANDQRIRLRQEIEAFFFRTGDEDHDG